MKAKKGRVIILGGGVTGLSIAARASTNGREVIVLEKGTLWGGMAVTFKKLGMLLDLGPHKVFSVDQKIMAEITRLVGARNMVRVTKLNKLKLFGKFYNFPLKLSEVLMGVPPKVAFSMMSGYLKTIIPGTKKLSDKNFSGYLTNRFGKTIYQMVFGQYADKVWGDPDRLSGELAKTRVAVPNLAALIKKMLFDKSNTRHFSVTHFIYPKKGIGEISKSLHRVAKQQGGTLLNNESVTKVVCKGDFISKIQTSNRVFTVNQNDIVINTLPLKLFCGLFGTNMPSSVSKAVNGLKVRHLLLVYVVISKKQIAKDNWFFFPEKEYIFNRVFEQKAFSKFMVPSNKTVLCAEITMDPTDERWKNGEKEISKRTVKDLMKAGLVQDGEVERTFAVKLPWVYPVLDLNFSSRLKKISSYLEGTFKNLFLVGRSGAFNYLGVADLLDISYQTADFFESGKNKPEWYRLKDSFNEYKIID